LAAPSFPKSQRAVIFDLWDTLTEPHAQRNRGRYTEEVGEILGAGGEVFSDLVAATFTERCRGELGDLRSTLRELCRRLGVEPTSPALEAAAAHRMDAQARLLQFRDDAVTVVERFRSHRWLTGLLTDSTCETEALWQQMELRHLFDAAAFSCAEARSKPDPSFYDVVVGRLGVEPGECLYVADGRSGELAGAARMGMRCVQLVTDGAPPGAEDWPGKKAPTLTAVADLALGVRCAGW
jgi:putative hydrolase of the HAD superfamily